MPDQSGNLRNLYKANRFYYRIFLKNNFSIIRNIWWLVYYSGITQ